MARYEGRNYLILADGATCFIAFTGGKGPGEEVKDTAGCGNAGQAGMVPAAQEAQGQVELRRQQ
ncbi:exoribonuclease R [Moorella thermoacetica Y72]|uniref:Exoribonuclease R n=1 Tax=Moorella thermoacetica Y72 TaxID=1325331 RepID=A0A0S6UBY3_NEOTH|nr:exoribonuclease R [Moorella thermoacetica Y72]